MPPENDTIIELTDLIEQGTMPDRPASSGASSARADTPLPRPHAVRLQSPALPLTDEQEPADRDIPLPVDAAGPAPASSAPEEKQNDADDKSQATIIREQESDAAVPPAGLPAQEEEKPLPTQASQPAACAAALPHAQPDTQPDAQTIRLQALEQRCQALQDQVDSLRQRLDALTADEHIEKAAAAATARILREELQQLLPE